MSQINFYVIAVNSCAYSQLDHQRHGDSRSVL